MNRLNHGWTGSEKSQTPNLKSQENPKPENFKTRRDHCFSSCAGLAVTVLLALGAGRVMACDMCSVYAAMTAQGGGGKGFFAGVVEQYIHEGTLQENGKEVANATGQYFNDSVTTLYAGYNINSRLDLQFNIPIIYRAYQRPVGNTIQTATESGVGDLSLVGNFVIYRKIEKD